MAKHKSQWNLHGSMEYRDDYGAWCGCRKPTDDPCKETLDRLEIERRLNAVEKLSAKDARVIAMVFKDVTREMLEAYANTLEAK